MNTTILVIDLLGYGSVEYPPQLQDAGFTVHVAFTVEDGLAMAKAQKPDFIVFVSSYLSVGDNNALHELRATEPKAIIGFANHAVYEKSPQEIDCDTVISPYGNIAAVIKYLQERVKIVNVS